jgi:hypothetical protein
MSPMINTNTHLPRRTFLRGLGVAVALPLLDGMIPAFGAVARAASRPVRRLGVIYVPNGVNMKTWAPGSEGAAYALSPTLEPLAPYKDRVLVLSGLCNKEADGLPGEGSGDHSRSQAAFLTGVHARKTEGSDIYAGVSMDQIAARELGKQTQLASLELALESNEIAGSGEDGYSAAYSGTIAWAGSSTPLPMLSDPRAAFERLFGANDSTDSKSRHARMLKDRSILDAITGELSHMNKVLGPGDRLKINEYVESVRDLERRIQRAEEQSERELPTMNQPGGAPEAFGDYARLMFDMMALAYQADLTRVATFLVGREKSSRAFPEIGVPEAHHPVSHHQNRPDLLEKKHKIDRLHVSLFAQFLEKLKNTPDGDGNLLDHSMILYGAGMADSDGHIHHNVPVVVAGGGAGQLKTGRHLRVGDESRETPLTNLHLTLLDKMGIPAEKLGDSTGTVATVSDI